MKVLSRHVYEMIHRSEHDPYAVIQYKNEESSVPEDVNVVEHVLMWIPRERQDADYIEFMFWDQELVRLYVVTQALSSKFVMNLDTGAIRYANETIEMGRLTDSEKSILNETSVRLLLGARQSHGNS